jgi:hypothetical protein
MLGTTIDGPPNELRVSWTGGQCDRLWHLEWGYDDSLFLWIKERDATCRLPAVRREFVLTLDHPVDIEKVTVSNGGAGG